MTIDSTARRRDCRPRAARNAAMNSRLLLLLPALVACSGGTDVNLGSTRLTIRDGDVVLSASGAPDARISKGGELRIGGSAIVVNDAQRSELAQYHAAATDLTTHAVSTGKAGADVGATAAKEVVSGLLHGDTSNVQAKIEQKAEVVKSEALKICGDVKRLHGLETAIANDLPAFRPYASLKDHDATRCEKDLKTSS
jgi:hypothetical protein